MSERRYEVPESGAVSAPSSEAADTFLERDWSRWRLEHGLLGSGLTFAAGLAVTGVSLFDGVPDPRLGILGLTLLALAPRACLPRSS